MKKENEELKCKYSQELMKNTELERDNKELKENMDMRVKQLTHNIELIMNTNTKLQKIDSKKIDELQSKCEEYEEKIKHLNNYIDKLLPNVEKNLNTKQRIGDK